jgi:chromate transporter
LRSTVLKKKDFRFYLKLFWATFSLSASTFGGGYVIVALMQKKFVEKYKWIEQNEMLDMVAIAQSAPGVMAVNASIITGYRLAGILGAFVSILGTILPPFIIISIISFFYKWLKDNQAVQAVFKSMSAGIAAVIADATVTMGKQITKEKSVISTAVMILAFIAIMFFSVDIKIIILVCAVIGVIRAFVLKKKKKEENAE